VKQTAPFDVVGLCPFERPDAGLVISVARAGGVGVLDLGRSDSARQSALRELAGCPRLRFGVRVPAGVAAPATLPDNVDLVVLARPSQLAELSESVRSRRIAVEVLSVEEGQRAELDGADVLVARGFESGGRVGEETAFVLLQRLVASCSTPVWVQGGIGVHTAAACAVGGAVGVVLDSQLALVRESGLSPQVQRLVRGSDGGDTIVVAGHRVLSRPDVPARALAGDEPTVETVEALLGGSDPQTELIPLGQDGAFAAELADTYASAGAVVAAIAASVNDHTRSAREASVLDRFSPLAAAHGTRYPIVQGPMTRVSDDPGFAEAVARGGGLPLIALSLLPGERARKLLRDTAERLGDMPWGVGILGFVPRELREQQLEAIAEVRPPVALIAGGRPSQAKPLEDLGIPSYLHVPSPGLLDLFLKEGARRFVFEGSECGGHVGPRSSFALWERQVERLMQVPDPENLHVLFAGGIHDARSAAMVAAMTGPLAKRGACVGVLMGTAYLFTKEIVETGAILPGFQEAATKCENTVLLETSPGHATRCAGTEFVDRFESRKRELVAAGADPKAMWAELEELNLGRLRVASKGLRREGGELVQVAEDEQRREGMYMLGQVAALRDEPLTIEALHSQVCDDGRSLLDECAESLLGDAPAPVEAAEPASVDVAIVGLACIYPGARDAAEFWSNTVRGVDAVTEVPRDRWNPDFYYDPEATGENAGEKTPSKWGGFLPRTLIDPLEYGIPPRSFASIEPVQLLSLEVARRALADAGYDKRPFARERASVIFGAEAGTDLSSAYGFRALLPQVVGEMPEALDAKLPKLTEDSFPGVLANVIAGRIANRLDLGGVNYTVDAACASSLAAVDLAVKELSTGSSDMVLCGGADLHNSINDYLLFASVHALSPTGRCHTFDAKADGITLGEGVACVVLKRLEDARRDGDRVYAVVKGVAGSSDGKSLGLTAPRKDGQKRALERAYRRSGVSPAEVGLVEAHGTGTVVGDRTELKALTEVYTAAGAEAGSCALGSVKSQIGHTKCAAGIAGLIKSAMACYAGVRPPTLNVKSPNPYWTEDSPFELSTAARPWAADERRAAISALGFGGTNFHVVVGSHDDGGPRPEVAFDAWPAELVLVRGQDPAAARSRAGAVAAWLARASDAIDAGVVRLRDVAAALAADAGPVQFAVAASDAGELADTLAAIAQGTTENVAAYARAADDAGKVAFLFPGQGSQRPGMLGDLFVAFPRLQDLCHLAPDEMRKVFAPTAFTPEMQRAQRDAVKDTRVAQPALGIADLAMFRLLERFGVEPDMAGGHSYGELVALCTAGAFDEAALVALSRARARCILDAAGDDPGTMAAVSAGADAVEQAVAGIDVVIANRNAPQQTVIAGPTPAVEEALAKLEAAGLSARPIPVACAFHSPVVAGAADALGQELAAADMKAPVRPVFANASAAPYPADADAAQALLAGQVASSVRFTDQIEAMYEAGARTFVEVGPGRVLSGLVHKILGDRPHVSVACDRPDEPGLVGLVHALAVLAVRGATIDTSALFAGRDVRAVDLDAAPPAVKKSGWWVDGHRAVPVVGELPAGSYEPFEEPVALVPAVAPAPAAHAGNGHGNGYGYGQGYDPVAPAAAPATGAEGAVLEYLRTVRDMALSSRDVMLGYLGQPSVARPVAAQPMAAQPVPAHPVAAQPAPAAAQPPIDVSSSPAAAPEPEAADPRATLLAIVSDRTGYPEDMLELDLDLEADLSIDSIKRIEILGELREQVGLEPPPGASEEQVVEELAAKKTLREIIDWLEANQGSRASEASANGDVVAPSPATEIVDVPARGSQRMEAVEVDAEPVPALGRYVLRPRKAPPAVANGVTLEGKRFALTDDGRGIATALAGILADRGAHTRIIEPGAALDDGDGGDDRPVDGLIHLAGLAPGADHETVKHLFELARTALMSGASWIFAATPHGGRFAAPDEDVPLGGIAGLLKTIAREWPEVKVRVFDLDPDSEVAGVAAHICAELVTGDRRIEVGYRDGERWELVAEAAADEAGARAGAAQAPLLDRDSVVLITGGARGITALVAVALAQRYQCRLELVGRSPAPAPTEDPTTAAAADANGIRSALIASGLRAPAEIEKRCRRLLAERAMRETFAAIEAAGGRVRYHSVDVRDGAAFGSLMRQLYAEYDRLDGVIHGAGVLEDRLMRDKTGESFSRVFDTKVAGALTIAHELRSDARFAVLFSSVSGVFGNRGQADYAAANDALDKLAHAIDRRIEGKALAIAWGPWAGTGMVSPELEREYRRRGVGLIDPGEGAELLLAELERGADGDVQIIAMCAEPEVMASGLGGGGAKSGRADTEGQGQRDQ